MRGARYAWHFKKGELIAFVDNDPVKIGGTYQGLPVISFDEYLEKHTDSFLIIGMIFEIEPIQILEKLGIKNYLLFSECPAEYHMYYRQNYLREYLKSVIDTGKKYLIYGCTFYAIQLSEMIYEMTGRYAAIVPSRNFRQDRFQAFKHTIKEEIPVLKTVEDVDADSVLAACEDDLDWLSGVSKCNSIINVFDCSDKIEDYHHPEIEVYKNKHLGESCFIIGNGPSLRISDLELLTINNIPTFGMNDIWMIFNKTIWRPTYYLAEDPRNFWDKYPTKDFILKSDEKIEMMFLGDGDKEFFRRNNPQGKYMIFHSHFEFSEFRHPKFSADLSRKSYEGGSVAYSCLQMAAYMGFNNIFLLGMDRTDPSKGKNQVYGHIYREENYTSISYDEGVRLADESAKKYVGEHGINVYNATRGGFLEVYDRVDFDTLFVKGKFMID